MDCPNCSNQMIHVGDHDDEDMDGEFYITSSLSCSKCKTDMHIYTPVKAPDAS